MSILFNNLYYKKTKQMYIAFKWLVSLALVMWLAMCFTTRSIEENTKKRRQDSLAFGLTFKNNSKKNVFKPAITTVEHNKYTHLHLVLFVAGTLAVSALIKKQKIIKFTKGKLAEINLIDICKVCVVVRTLNLKFPALGYSDAIAKCLHVFWKKLKTYGHKIKRNIFLKIKRTSNSTKDRFQYNILLTKLKHAVEEKTRLDQLLMSAIQENKKIRTQCALETLAKNRLSQHIDNINKQIKEHRSRYPSFQNLYLITHEENIFLKSRIRKLAKEKEDAEKDLVGLINEVYKTNNYDLKSYCSRYLVKTRNSSNTLNSEIQIFLRNTRTPACSSTLRECFQARNKNTTSSENVSVCRDMTQDNSLVPLVANSPKLKGLPGEYVWTVKDKDGIIEKLYEYDCEPGYDNGETVRKLREYSVYYDKDWLLDFSNPLPEREVSSSSVKWNEFQKGNKRIVTGSQAFRTFLQNNKSIMPSANNINLWRSGMNK